MNGLGHITHEPRGKYFIHGRVVHGRGAMLASKPSFRPRQQTERHHQAWLAT